MKLVSAQEMIDPIVAKYTTYERMFNILWEYYTNDRHYHGKKHIHTMFDAAARKGFQLTPELMLAIIFHDAVYNPDAPEGKNENDSVLALGKAMNMSADGSKQIFEQVSHAILCTNHSRLYNPTRSLIAEQLVELDLDVFSRPWPEQLEYETGIFREHQHHPIQKYVAGRIEALKALRLTRDIDAQPIIDYVRNKTYRIGIYAGSFNPFHHGHYHVLREATTLFDKVIIAKYIGNKAAQVDVGCKSLPKGFERIIFDGKTIYSQFPEIAEARYTFIRGLRNSSDLQHEQDWKAYLRDQECSYPIIYIMPELNQAHISSTGIRELMQIAPDVAETYIWK